MGFSLWKFVPNSGIRTISLQNINCCKYCQLSSTDNCRQLITLSVTYTFVNNMMGVTKHIARVCLIIS